MHLAHLARVNVARRARRGVVRIIDINDGRDTVIVEGDACEDDLAAAVHSALRSGKSGLAEIAGRTCFLNVYLPPPRIVVIGAVHIAQALASIARMVGFDTQIVDPRTAFATSERFEGADLRAEWPEDALSTRPLDAYTALVALAHAPEIDDLPLAMALRADCFYIGALGSRKTQASRLGRLQRQGFSRPELDRIRGPIGLDIGADGPAEIAVAIIAEIIQALRKRSFTAGNAQ